MLSSTKYINSISQGLKNRTELSPHIYVYIKNVLTTNTSPNYTPKRHWVVFNTIIYTSKYSSVNLL